MQRLSLCIQWLGLCLAALSVFGAHPFFAAGTWADTETVNVVLFTAAALAFLGLSLNAAATKAALRSICHPVCLLLAATGIWSFTGAANADFKSLAILGAPQTGQGVIWYFAFAGFTASAINLRKHPDAFRSLLVIAAIAAVVSSYLNLSNVPWVAELIPSMIQNGFLFGFNEYQAYYALGLVIIATIGVLRGEKRFPAVIFVSAIILLILSRNRLAIVAIGLIAILFLLVTLTPYGRRAIIWLEKQKYLSASIITALLLAAAFPVLLIRLVDFQSIEFSLWSRTILQTALDPSLFESLRASLFGHGWGHFQEYLLRNLPSTGIDIYETSWSDITRDEFHSHNGPTDALFAMGLPGLLLTIAFPVFVVLFAQQRWLIVSIGFALAWTALDGFWFMMPATMMIVAMAIGAMAETSHSRLPFQFRRYATGIRLAASLTMISIAILSVTSAVTLRSYNLAVEQINTCLTPGKFEADCASLDFPEDPFGSEFAIAKTIENSQQDLLQSYQDNTLPVGQAALYQHVIEDAIQRAKTNGSATLLMALNNTIGRSVFKVDGDTALLGSISIRDEWPAIITELLKTAPLRLDVLHLYCNWLLLQNDADSLNHMLDLSESINADHPVVLWYRGISQIDTSDIDRRRQGLEKMRTAIETGVERFMPVSDEIKSALINTDR